MHIGVEPSERQLTTKTYQKLPKTTKTTTCRFLVAGSFYGNHLKLSRPLTSQASLHRTGKRPPRSYFTFSHKSKLGLSLFYFPGAWPADSLAPPQQKRELPFPILRQKRGCVPYRTFKTPVSQVCSSTAANRPWRLQNYNNFPNPAFFFRTAEHSPFFP